MEDRIPEFATLAVHAGAQPDPTTGAQATPIYQTTSHVFDNVEHAASLFGLEGLGNIDTRIIGPTSAVLEERIAALEGGSAGLAVASGHAARILVFHALMRPGDEVVAARQLSGGSINQFNHAFKSLGWNVNWADIDDLTAKTLLAAVNGELRARIGLKARAFVEANHSLQNTIGEYATTLATLVERQRASDARGVVFQPSGQRLEAPLGQRGVGASRSKT